MMTGTLSGMLEGPTESKRLVRLSRRWCQGLACTVIFSVAPAYAAETVILNESLARACYFLALRGADASDIDTCDRALELENLQGEDLAATLSNRGLLLARSGRIDRALEDHGRAIALAPDVASLYINRANALTRAKRFEDALLDLDLAVEIAAGRSAAPLAADGVEGGDGQLAEQAPMAGELAVSGPAAAGGSVGNAAELAAAHFNRALIRHRLGNSRAALEDAEMASQLIPDRSSYATLVIELRQIVAAAESSWD